MIDIIINIFGIIIVVAGTYGVFTKTISYATWCIVSSIFMLSICVHQMIRFNKRMRKLEAEPFQATKEYFDPEKEHLRNIPQYRVSVSDAICWPLKEGQTLRQKLISNLQNQYSITNVDNICVTFHDDEFFVFYEP
jgi:hypothetical protein